MLDTIGHHTVEDKDNADYIENNSPFRIANIDQAYLGSGYYFWDNHINLAHWWGDMRYDGQYVICEGKFTVPSELFFDLVGDREAQISLEALISEFNLENEPLGQVFEFLKKLEKRPDMKGIFPYKVIRAADQGVNSYEQKQMKFASKRKGVMSLTPMYIICLIEKNQLHLHSYKIVYPDHYVQD